MSMEFGDDNEIRGGGGALMGLLAGSALNKDRDDGRSMTWFAMVIVLIVFFIAIIFLALAFKDRGYDKVNHNGNYGELLATMIAAKGMDSNGCKNGDFDMLEIKQKLEHNEDRATARETQQIISQQGQSFMQLGFGLSNQIKDSEKDNLKEFGEIKQQLGAQSMALQQLLTKSNNSDIINGVIMQLTMGAPRVC